MSTTDEITFDSRLEAFSEQLFGAALSYGELTVAHLGRRLGLYQTLRGAGGLTVVDVAARAGIDGRYAQEWLEQQAVAGVLTVDDAGAPADRRRYALPEAHAVALLDEEHPAYVGALADLPPILGRTLDAVASAFVTGAGVPFADYGVHDMQAGFTRPMFASSFVAEWIPALPDVHARLTAGEPVRIADVGCGEGWAAIYLAEAYPEVTVHGFDLDDVSVAAARKLAADRGVADRVHFEVRDLTIDSETTYDLVFACEVIHDVADPVAALRVIRRLAGDAGAVLIIDENASESFEAPGDPIQRFLYAFSVLHCLPVGRTVEPSAATGTVMRPSTLRAYAQAAGFADVDLLPIENPVFRFYRPRS